MRFIATTFALLVIIAASSPFVPAATQAQTSPVTLDISFSTWDTNNPDPQLASSEDDYELSENLFIGLVDAAYGYVQPELAISWTVSADSLTWTFVLRDDVQWVRYDPTTQAIEPMRKVVAADVVYGIKRGCMPNRDETGRNFDYGTLLAKVIAGCDVLNAMPDAGLTDAVVQGDTVKVRAPSDTVVEIDLQAPAGYLGAMATLPIMRPVPPEVVSAEGSAWLDGGQMWTSGPFVMTENTVSQRVFLQNPFYPIATPGNIEQVNLHFIEDGGTAYALAKDGQLDQTRVPQSEFPIVVELPPNMVALQIPSNAVFYFGFNLTKPPFDNVHVRRAFNAMFDRQAFIEQIVGGRGLPMLHFTPPEVSLAPAREEIGVLLDYTYARREMELAGYPNCEGFPQIDIAAYQGAGTWGEFLAYALEEELGCDPALFNNEQLEFSVLTEIIGPDTPADERPHLWTLGWRGDYPDPHGWLYEVLYCRADNPFGRPCSAVDDLLLQAARASHTSQARPYVEIESRLFGPDGEFPILPIFQRASYELFQIWFVGPHEHDGVIGGRHWDAYRIDMAAKLAARNTTD